MLSKASALLIPSDREGSPKVLYESLFCKVPVLSTDCGNIADVLPNESVSRVSDNDFRDLMRFVRAVEFDHLGCFTYSKEQGTVAGRMSNQIAKDVMLERQSELMALQQGISQRKLRSYIGSRQKVLVKGLSDETDLLYEGRLATQAPEVDGLVYINDGPALPGQIQEVLITETHEYDLVGEVVVKSESCDGHFS